MLLEPSLGPDLSICYLNLSSRTFSLVSCLLAPVLILTQWVSNVALTWSLPAASLASPPRPSQALYNWLPSQDDLVPMRKECLFIKAPPAARKSSEWLQTYYAYNMKGACWGHARHPLPAPP